MSRPLFLLPALSILGLAAVAGAHGVDYAVVTTTAISVTATHEDGDPLADAAWSATPPGEDAPRFSGRTDAQGRLLFVPDRPGDWRVEAFTPDGHGFVTEVSWSGADTSADNDAKGGAASLRLLAGIVVAGFAGFLGGRVRRRA